MPPLGSHPSSSLYSGNVFGNECSPGYRTSKITLLRQISVVEPIVPYESMIIESLISRQAPLSHSKGGKFRPSPVVLLNLLQIVVISRCRRSQLVLLALP